MSGREVKSTQKTYLEELQDMSWKLSQQLHPSSPNSIDILGHMKPIE
jgi:hypothetical protein